MLELLENAAEQLGIKVSYEALQTSGLQTGLRGGLCNVKVVLLGSIDKRATDEERVATLAGAISRFDTSELELAQKVRDCIHMYEGTGPRRAA